MIWYDRHRISIDKQDERKQNRNPHNTRFNVSDHSPLLSLVSLLSSETQKSIYRNMFGTGPEGQLASFLNINLKNTANTNLIIWGKGDAR